MMKRPPASTLLPSVLPVSLFATASGACGRGRNEFHSDLYRLGCCESLGVCAFLDHKTDASGKSAPQDGYTHNDGAFTSAGLNAAGGPAFSIAVISP